MKPPAPPYQAGPAHGAAARFRPELATHFGLNVIAHERFVVPCWANEMLGQRPLRPHVPSAKTSVKTATFFRSTSPSLSKSACHPAG